MGGAGRAAIGITCAAAITGGILLLGDSGSGRPEHSNAASSSSTQVVPELPADPPASTPSGALDGAAEPDTDTEPDPVRPSGFELIAARVTAGDGTVCELCLWLADSVELRNRGLMGVTDLGPADGMAFVYPEPHTTRFWMKDTLLPLSIAFYAADAEFIGSFDMQPCVAVDSNECERYPTPTDFLIAVETAQGELATAGLLAGSTLQLLELPCEP